MAVKLALAPAALGKTQACIEQVLFTLHSKPLSDVWILLPDRNQVRAFRQRLASRGGVLGARPGTFGDLYTAVLAEAGKFLPLTADAVIYRLTLAAIDAVAERQELKHYASIRRRPGFIRALMTLIAELKRTRVDPVKFQATVQGHGPRLEELARLYGEYQAALIRLEWADPEGLGWLAVEALQNDPALASGIQLVMADGFDSFTLTQLEMLRLLAGRVKEMRLTLAGDAAMERPAYRRFARTLDQICETLHPAIVTLPARANPHPELAHLEAFLFEQKADKPPKPDTEPRVRFLEAQTLALEAREALRWLKAHLVRNKVRPDECAITARNLTPYQPFLREAGREFGLPLRFAGGEPLSTNPAISAILNLLELSLQKWARRPLLDAIRTPYFDLTRFGLVRQDHIRLKRVAYWGQVIQGWEQWQEVFDRLAASTDIPMQTDEEDESTFAELPRGLVARELATALKGFVTRATPPQAGPLVTLVEWIEDLLSKEKGLDVPGQIEAQQDTAARDRAALAAFRDILRSLVFSERIVGERTQVTWVDLLQELRGAVEAAEYVPDEALPPDGGAIYVAHLGAVRGIAYRAVALLGLSEGLFPEPLSEDPFLSDEERAAFNGQGLALEPRLRSDQQTLFYEAVTRASEYLLLTRPYLADDGEWWEPSPYWEQALALYDSQPRRVRAEDVRYHTEAGSVVELLADAVRRRGLPKAYAQLEPDWERLRASAQVLHARVARVPQSEYEGCVDALASALTERYAAEHIWSASRMETYAGCPFRFLISHALDLEPLETPEPGYDPAQLGGMLHEILEKVYQRAGASDIESLVRTLPDVARDVFRAAPEKQGFRPTAWWKAQQEELVEKLENTLRNLAAEAEGYSPIRFELGFGFRDGPPLALDTPSGRVLFHGVIDRVDRNDAGKLRVIDYKTGMSHLDQSALAEGRRLQLVLYALAAEETLGLGQVVDGFYWGILKGKAGSLHLDSFRYTQNDCEYVGMQGAIELTRRYVAANVRGVRTGAFPPIPPHDDCPHYCAAKSICWRYRASEF